MKNDNLIISHLFNLLWPWIVKFLYVIEMLAQALSCLNLCVLQRFCPHLMHLALDFYSVVDVSIMQVALSFPVMVCLSGEGELRFGKAKSLGRSD